jgi:uncharacterized Rossmann fold enzyme
LESRGGSILASAEGVETKRVVNVGGFTDGQRSYLDFHRNAVLLRAVR